MTGLTPAVYNLGPLVQIPEGEGRQFSVGGQLVAVFRQRDGQLRATQAICTHQGGPLADGIIGGGQVICPLHGFRFDLSSGQSFAPGCASLRTYAVWLATDGTLNVDIGA